MVMKFWKTVLFAFIIVLLLVPTFLFLPNYKDDQWFRDRAVQIRGNQASCSAVQIKAPSGKNYLLTASHCKPLATNGRILAISEHNAISMPKIIAEDPESDLLLLEGIKGVQGLELGKYSHRNDHVRTYTHGHGLKTYKTEGELIEKRLLDIPMYPYPQGGLCSLPKEKVLSLRTPWASEEVCVMSVREMYMTAPIAPGSSGGMVVNDDGDLIGIVSAMETGTIYGLIVDIEEIRNFLYNY